MAHRIALSAEASKALNNMATESGMSEDDLVTAAILALESSGRILQKSQHDKLVSKVVETLGDYATEYDADAIARAIAHEGFVSPAMSGNIFMGENRWDGRYLGVANLSIPLKNYAI